MTAKRFNISIDNKNGVGLYDGDIRLLYFQFSNIEDATSCEDALIHQCSLMNELHEENQYLKSLQWYQDCINEISIGMQQRQLLEKENEQLRKELDKLELVNEMLSMDFSNSEHELLRENEQLRKEVEDLKHALIHSAFDMN